MCHVRLFLQEGVAQLSPGFGVGRGTQGHTLSERTDRLFSSGFANKAIQDNAVIILGRDSDAEKSGGCISGQRDRQG